MTVAFQVDPGQRVPSHSLCSQCSQSRKAKDELGFLETHSLETTPRPRRHVLRTPLQGSWQSLQGTGAGLMRILCPNTISPEKMLI